MAQTKKCKQMHTEQVAAAQEMFESYKKFIVEEFVDKFGGSYETASNLPADWRTYYSYKPECEEFLIERTKTFIHVAPSVDRKYKSPTFLRNLTSFISEYLSTYIAKKGWKRNDCTKYLQELLFSKNQHVQKETQRYVAKNNRDWGLQQKQRREQESKRKRPRISDTVIQQEEPQKSKKVKKPFLTPSQEKKARKRMEYIHNVIMNQHNLTVCVSVKTIEK